MIDDDDDDDGGDDVGGDDADAADDDDDADNDSERTYCVLHQTYSDLHPYRNRVQDRMA